MQRSRSKTPKRSIKRSRTSRSTSRPARRALFPRRALALAAPSVGLGTSATTVLRTSFFVNVTATGATGVFTGFLKPGSCFDPCGDLAAVQPQMFDQFSVMYSRYKVNSCSVRIKITGNAGLTSAAWVAAAYPAVDSTALTTYQSAASQQYAKTTSGGFQTVSTNGTGSEGKYLSFRLNHNSIVGSKSDTWDIGGAVTADPTAGQFMVLPLFLQAVTNSASTWVLEIDMWQNVTFSQKKNTVDA